MSGMMRVSKILKAHYEICTGAVLHHADVPALPSGVRLPVPQGSDLLLHQQRNHLHLPLLRLLPKSVQEERKDRMKISGKKSHTHSRRVLSFRYSNARPVSVPPFPLTFLSFVGFLQCRL